MYLCVYIYIYIHSQYIFNILIEYLRKLYRIRRLNLFYLKRR